jgi:uracil-DNA glycosylase
MALLAAHGAVTHPSRLLALLTPSMTETVKAFAQYGLQFFPLPHPSWRSVIWMREHHWFEETVIPTLRKVVRTLI